MKLVSCILPTRGRPQYAAQSVECFLSQTYPLRELVILDDADDPSFPSGIALDGVGYLRLSERQNIPWKRNKCCDLAQGEIIAHFDSDDWSAPERLDVQMKMLEDANVALSGFRSMLFYDVAKNAAYKYWGASTFVIGSSFLYTKEWWTKNRWMERKPLASDHNYWSLLNTRKQVVTTDAGQLMVARVHSNNTSSKRLTESPYKKASLEDLPAGFPR